MNVINALKQQQQTKQTADNAQQALQAYFDMMQTVCWERSNTFALNSAQLASQNVQKIKQQQKSFDTTIILQNKTKERLQQLQKYLK